MTLTADVFHTDDYTLVAEDERGPVDRPAASEHRSVAALVERRFGAGGRVFASHWHNWWFEKAPPPMPTVAPFNHRSDPASPLTATIDTTFPKGEALADWLVNVGGATTRGELSINAAKRTVQSVNMPAAQRWIYNTAQASVQYFTANTPVGAPVEMLCGRAVFSDIHVTADNNFMPGPFPSECGAVADLSPQEKALEFMLFDLSSCIQDDTKPPPIP